MRQVLHPVAAVLLVITLNYTTGIKWIQLQSGDAIPTNAISLTEGGKEFVGRSRHYDEILPAEVNSSFAVIESCGKNIIKRHYEILVSRDNCRWQLLGQYENVPETIVRAGTASNGEPIYVGKINNQNRTPYVKRIQSIYLTTKTKNKMNPDVMYVLVCDDYGNWIDTAAGNIPNKTVYGGVSEDRRHLYVARLKSGCAIIPGQVMPELGIATAEYKHEQIQSPFCQVLVGDTNEYSWVKASNGDIPDYAVVSSKEKTGELMYVAALNNTLGYITSSIAVKLNDTYGILVKNVV